MAINAFFHITPTGATTKTGATWATAMDMAAFITHLEGAVVAGDVHFIMDGSYTVTEDLDCTARDGAAGSPIVMIGVKSGTTNEGANVVYSDWSRDAADRPFIDGGSYTFNLGDYYILRNLDFQTNTASGVYQGAYGYNENCKFMSPVENANYATRSGRCHYINCEMSSTGGFALRHGGSGLIMFCYFYDSPTGIYSASFSTCFGNIFDDNTIGIDALSNIGLMILNNTLYGGSYGINSAAPYNIVTINNICEGQSVGGFRSTTQTDSNLYMYNHGDDTRCTDMWIGIDTTTIFQDYEVTTGDPKFTTSGSDFSLQNDSPNLGAGMSIDLGVG